MTIWLQTYRLRLKLNFIFRNKTYDHFFMVVMDYIYVYILYILRKSTVIGPCSHLGTTRYTF